MSVEYVRKYYGVPAKRGRAVSYDGKRGRITSADHCLRIRFEGERFSWVIHPTDEDLIYLSNAGEPMWPALNEGD